MHRSSLTDFESRTESRTEHRLTEEKVWIWYTDNAPPPKSLTRTSAWLTSQRSPPMMGHPRYGHATTSNGVRVRTRAYEVAYSPS